MGSALGTASTFPPPHMVLVEVTDTAWVECVQNEQNEAAKAQLAAAQEQAQQLQGELASLQAEYEAACAAKAELVKELGQLEKRVGSPVVVAHNCPCMLCLSVASPAALHLCKPTASLRHIVPMI